MARTAECAAPEGNRGRDEWMTVIEMREYMRASRNKAYDLIWSGEIDSYRLGRKLLVSRACAMLRISRDAMFIPLPSCIHRQRML